MQENTPKVSPYPKETFNEDLAKIDKLATMLDKQFRLPGGFYLGLDGLIGLIPGVGDAVGAGLSLWIINKGRQYGIPKRHIAKMFFNMGIDAALGSIPLLGDVFDFAWKANVKNTNILKRELQKKADAQYIQSD